MSQYQYLNFAFDRFGIAGLIVVHVALLGACEACGGGQKSGPEALTPIVVPNASSPATTPATPGAAALTRATTAEGNGAARTTACPAPPDYALAVDLISMLCRVEAPFLGQPVCDEWHAFEAGTAPLLPVGTIALGPTFRVERANSGARVWSEMNPTLAVANAGSTDAPTAMRMLRVSADNPAEQQEGEEYMRQLFAGTPPANSGLYQYIASELPKAQALTVTTEPNQAVIDGGCGGRSYMRRAPGRLYVLTASTHSNAWEYDNHPVIYFSILAGHGGGGR